MPDGDIYTTQQPDRAAHYGTGAKLVDNANYAAATANVYTGPWVDISTLKFAQAEVIGATLTGTVNIEGTNIDNPVAATTGYALCVALTASGLSALALPIRWVRARISGFTAGSVSVQLHGVA
jgi:hypothetical protein